jgi:hypothetical protein
MCSFFTLQFNLQINDLVVEAIVSYLLPARNEMGRKESKEPTWGLGGSTVDSCKRRLEEGNEVGSNKGDGFISKDVEASHFVAAKYSSFQQSIK